MDSMYITDVIKIILFMAALASSEICIVKSYVKFYNGNKVILFKYQLFNHFKLLFVIFTLHHYFLLCLTFLNFNKKLDLMANA